jgi:hypothetical protein
VAERGRFDGRQWVDATVSLPSHLLSAITVARSPDEASSLPHALLVRSRCLEEAPAAGLTKACQRGGEGREQGEGAG